MRPTNSIYYFLQDIKIFFYDFFIGVALLYNIVLVSTNSKVNQLSVYIYPLSWIPSH